MKLYKYFLGLSVVLLGVLTSCNTDVEGVCYSPMGANVSFETAKPSAITTSETSVTIPVRIIRSITTGSYTANFTAEASEDGIFSNDANGSVTFADGQGVATINVVASNLAKGVDYTYTLNLGDAEKAAADTITKTQNLKTVIKIHSDYNWVNAGTCTFVDYTFSSSDNGSGKAGIPVIHAEGTNLYRIVQPFIAIYGSNTFKSDSGVDFYLASDNSINFGTTEGYIYTVFDDADNYGYWNTTDYADNCTIQQNGNVFQVSHLLIYNGSLYTGAFAFQWNGWPGAN